MSKIQFSCFLSTIAAFVVFFYSVNVFYYETGKEYMQVKMNEGHFGAINNTCLVRATIVKEKFDKEGIPAKVLIFHCEKDEKNKFSHAVVIFVSNGHLFIFDNDGSSFLGKLSDINLDSDPEKVISIIYLYVKSAQWLTIPK